MRRARVSLRWRSSDALLDRGDWRGPGSPHHDNRLVRMHRQGAVCAALAAQPTQAPANGAHNTGHTVARRQT